MAQRIGRPNDRQYIIDVIGHIIRIDLGPKKKAMAVAASIYRELASRGVIADSEANELTI